MSATDAYETRGVMKSTDDQKAESIYDYSPLARTPGTTWMLESIVNHPKELMITIVIFFGVSLAIGISPYESKVQATPALQDMFTVTTNNRLRDIDDKIGRHFKLATSEPETMVFWCDSCNLSSSQEFTQARQEIAKKLQEMKQSPVYDCAGMTWSVLPGTTAGSSVSEDRTLSTISVVGTDSCKASLRRHLPVGKHIYNSFQSSFASMHQVTQYSQSHVFSEFGLFLLVFFPVMSLVRVMVVSGALRGLMPLLSIGISYMGSRALLFIYKWIDGSTAICPIELIVLVNLLVVNYDFALFFWCTFTDVREEHSEEEPDEIRSAVLKTCKQVAPVIWTSSLLIGLCFIAFAFLPAANVVGLQGALIQACFGVLLSGCFSIILPTASIMAFPATFDIPKDRGSVRSWGRRKFFLPFRECVSRWSSKITAMPCMVLAPILICLFFVPGWIELGLYTPAYDTLLSMTYMNTNAYHARTAWQDRAPSLFATVLMEAEPVGSSLLQEPSITDDSINLRGNRIGSQHHLAVHTQESMSLDLSSVSTLAEGFQKFSCDFVAALIDDTLGEDYQIDAYNVQGLWWNNGTCVHLNHSSETTHREFVSDDGNMQIMHVYTKVKPMGRAAAHLTRHLWGNVEPRFRRGLDIGGQRYIFRARHTSEVGHSMLLAGEWTQAFPTIMLVSLLVALALLAFMFSSLVVPIRLFLTIFLPFIAIFGYIIGIFQDGWLQWISPPFQHDGLIWVCPYFAFPITAAMAIDNDIFLSARVHHFRMSGYDNLSAIRLGMIDTQPIIVAAGAVMMIASFAFYCVHTEITKQLGLYMCLGAIIDAWIVRQLLVPPLLALCGEWSYWPGKAPTPTKHYHKN